MIQDEIEYAFRGLDFLSALPDAVETDLEAGVGLIGYGSPGSNAFVGQIGEQR